MSTAWILIADASFAKIYRTHLPKIYNNGHDPNELELVAEFDHASSRKKFSELVSDQAGRYQFGMNGHGKYEAAVLPRAHEANVFAKQLAEVLNKGRATQQFDELLIVANPTFHGRLIKYFDEPLKKVIKKTIHKNYTKLAPKNLIHELAIHL